MTLLQCTIKKKLLNSIFHCPKELYKALLCLSLSLKTKRKRNVVKIPKDFSTIF